MKFELLGKRIDSQMRVIREGIKKFLKRQPKIIPVPKKQGVYILELKESRGGNRIEINDGQVCIYHDKTLLYANSGYAVACYGEQGNYLAVKDKLIDQLKERKIK